MYLPALAAAMYLPRLAHLNVPILIRNRSLEQGVLPDFLHHPGIQVHLFHQISISFAVSVKRFSTSFGFKPGFCDSTIRNGCHEVLPLMFRLNKVTFPFEQDLNIRAEL